MKRNKFVMTLFSMLPLAALANLKNKEQLRTDKGFKTNAGEGRTHGHIKLKGVNANILDIKISGKDTDGALVIFEQTSLSQGKGTPLHVHFNQDEVFYVIEGNYYFQVGDEKFNLATGDSIFLPKQVPHAWTQISEFGKMTVVFQPAGKMEDFFLQIAALDHEPSTKEMEQIFKDNEMEIVGPPLKLEK